MSEPPRSVPTSSLSPRLRQASAHTSSRSTRPLRTPLCSCSSLSCVSHPSRPSYNYGPASFVAASAIYRCSSRPLRVKLSAPPRRRRMRQPARYSFTTPPALAPEPPLARSIRSSPLTPALLGPAAAPYTPASLLRSLASPLLGLVSHSSPGAVPAASGSWDYASTSHGLPDPPLASLLDRCVPGERLGQPEACSPRSSSPLGPRCRSRSITHRPPLIRVPPLRIRARCRPLPSFPSAPA